MVGLGAIGEGVARLCKGTAAHPPHLAPFASENFRTFSEFSDTSNVFGRFQTFLDIFGRFRMFFKRFGMMDLESEMY